MLLIVSSIFFSLYKDEIHLQSEKILAEEVFHGDSLSVGTVGFISSFKLQPGIKMGELKIWGRDGISLPPTFHLYELRLIINWGQLFSMLADASSWQWGKQFFKIKNEKVRIKIDDLIINGGSLEMLKTSKGSNNKLFRPSKDKIEKFASGMLKMSGGFEIGNFELRDFHILYIKDTSSNKEELLPKIYDLNLYKLNMRLSSDPNKAYFDDISMEGRINSIIVGNSEGLEGRDFQAKGGASLKKLSLQQKLNDDVGFDLTLDNFDIFFKDLKTIASGKISNLNEKLLIDIDFNSKTGVLNRQNESLISFLELVLSDRFLSIIKSYNPLGEIQFRGKVFNTNNVFGGPLKIDLDYEAQNTSFEFKFFEEGEVHIIENLHLNGTFEVGGNSPSYLSADILNGSLYENQDFEGKLILDNVFRREYMDSVQQVEDPAFISVDFDSREIDFQKLLRFMEFQYFDTVSGTMDFENFHLSGPLSTLLEDYKELDYHGRINMEDVEMIISGDDLPFQIDLKNSNGFIDFSRSFVQPRLSFDINGMETKIMDGRIGDFVPYIFNRARDTLFLNDFDVLLPELSVRDFIKDRDNSHQGLIQTVIKNTNGFIGDIINSVKMKGTKVRIENLIMDSLYSSGTDYFPNFTDDWSAGIGMQIDQRLSIDFGFYSSSDFLNLQLEAGLGTEDVKIISTIYSEINDISDFFCQSGINLSLGDHKDIPLKLKTDFTSVMSLGEGSGEIQINLDGSRIYNEERGINIGVKSLDTRFGFSDLKLSENLVADISLNLDDQTISSTLLYSPDSIQLISNGLQNLRLETAKKYLSLICEIDQNLSRLNALEGELGFMINFKDNMQKNQVKRQGVFDIKNVSFGFLKGTDTIQFDHINGYVDYNDKETIIQELTGVYGESDFKILGTNVQNLLNFFLLGEPVSVDTIRIKSNRLDLSEILGNTASQKYRYDCPQATEVDPIPNKTYCPSCLENKPLSNGTKTQIAFSLINFLKQSQINHFEGHFNEILFKPIVSSETFKIDNLDLDGYLLDSRLVFSELKANAYQGLVYQYQPLEIFIINDDSLEIVGGYSMKDLEVDEIIDQVASSYLSVLDSSHLDLQGRLSFELGFFDTLTAFTDINTFDLRVTNFNIHDGSAKPFDIIDAKDKWKRNVGPFMRMAASLVLGNFKKKFERPTEYLIHINEILLTDGELSFDILESYSNQLNVVSTGSYQIRSEKRGLEVLLQKGYTFENRDPTYCKEGFLTYFNVTDYVTPSSKSIAPSPKSISKYQSRLKECLSYCPCSDDQCQDVCNEQVAPPSEKKEVKNKIKFMINNKKLKEYCK